MDDQEKQGMDDQEKQEYESPAVEQVETEDHPAVTAGGDQTDVV